MAITTVGQTIPRDPALFLWILIPITAVMILTTILRHYAMIFLQQSPKQQDQKEIRQATGLMYGSIFRTNGPSIMTASTFTIEKQKLTSEFKSGYYLASPEKKDQSGQAQMPQLDGMVNMMKTQAVMMLPQTVIMGWVNAFFSGFVVLKLPFPLTPQFKPMLQSGVGTRDLDARWVSSLSWYFLTLFGLQPVYTYLLGGAGSNNAAMSQMQPMMPTSMFGAEQNAHKLFAAEAENLAVTESHSILQGIEGRFISRYQSIGISSSRALKHGLSSTLGTKVNVK